MIIHWPQGTAQHLGESIFTKKSYKVVPQLLTVHSRLNLQHYLWKQHFGYLTHPNIDCLRGENIKIADVGTGTGIWLLDLSESLPASVQLHGFDVNLSQVPPKQWLPPNVSMRELNIYEEIPDDLLEQYGIIRGLEGTCDDVLIAVRCDSCSVLHLRRKRQGPNTNPSKPNEDA